MIRSWTATRTVGRGRRRPARTADPGQPDQQHRRHRRRPPVPEPRDDRARDGRSAAEAAPRAGRRAQAVTNAGPRPAARPAAGRGHGGGRRHRATAGIATEHPSPTRHRTTRRTSPGCQSGGPPAGRVSRAGRARADSVTAVQTYRGPIDTAELGITLMHEHIFVRDPRARARPPELAVGRPAATSSAPCAQLDTPHDLGIRTVVDLTVPGLGRDVRTVAAVADESPVHLVAATGWYAKAPCPCTSSCADPGGRIDGPDELAHLFLRDLEEGIAGTDDPGRDDQGRDGRGRHHRRHRADHGGRRGGASGDRRHDHHPLAPGLPERTRPAARSCGRAACRSTGSMIGHSGDTEDLDYLRALIDEGSTIGMDRFGMEHVLPDDRRVANGAGAASARVRGPDDPLARCRCLQPRDAAVVAGADGAAVAHGDDPTPHPAHASGWGRVGRRTSTRCWSSTRGDSWTQHAGGRWSRRPGSPMRCGGHEGGAAAPPGRDRRRRCARSPSPDPTTSGSRSAASACAARTWRSSEATWTAPQYPWIQGHEAFGRVESVGERVPTDRIGEIVVVEPNVPCFACPQCRAWPDLGVRSAPVRGHEQDRRSGREAGGPERQRVGHRRAGRTRTSSASSPWPSSRQRSVDSASGRSGRRSSSASDHRAC